jgi:hypothetical protein
LRTSLNEVTSGNSGQAAGRSPGEEWATVSHGGAGLVVEAEGGGATSLPFVGGEVGAESFQGVVMFIVGNEAGVEIEPGGPEDLLEAFQPRVTLPCSMALIALLDVPARSARPAWVNPVRWRACTTNAPAKVGIRSPGLT